MCQYTARRRNVPRIPHMTAPHIGKEKQMSEKESLIISDTKASDVSSSKSYEIKPETPHGGKVYIFFKRFFDILVSLSAFLILFIPMFLIGIAVKLTSKGPVLFSQERLGIGGKPFTIFKFRTMRIDAEANGPQWAKENDDRCTKLGRVLRKTRLDELPQLWNILIGDMSFVGPRPERKFFYDKFETYIHGFSNRLAVKPGLTGLAQINGGYSLAPEEKVVYDMEYIRTQTIWLDTKLMFKTIRLFFTQEGAR